MMENDAAFADLARRNLELLQIPRERRHDRRVRLSAPLPARLGKIDGLLIDLGARGARMRHATAATVGAESRLSIDWPGGPFRALVRVLSSRVIVAAPAAKFESRLQFVEVTPENRKVLDRILRTMNDRQLRQWIANFMGDAVYPGDEEQGQARALLRYRFDRGHWTARPADADEPQPLDGFIVPASMEPHDINLMCAAYGRLDRDGRQLFRLFASAAPAA